MGNFQVLWRVLQIPWVSMQRFLGAGRDNAQVLQPHRPTFAAPSANPNPRFVQFSLVFCATCGASKRYARACMKRAEPACRITDAAFVPSHQSPSRVMFPVPWKYLLRTGWETLKLGDMGQIKVNCMLEKVDDRFWPLARLEGLDSGDLAHQMASSLAPNMSS